MFRGVIDLRPGFAQDSDNDMPVISDRPPTSDSLSASPQSPPHNANSPQPSEPDSDCISSDGDEQLSYSAYLEKDEQSKCDNVENKPEYLREDKQGYGVSLSMMGKGECPDEFYNKNLEEGDFPCGTRDKRRRLSRGFAHVGAMLKSENRDHDLDSATHAQVPFRQFASSELSETSHDSQFKLNPSSLASYSINTLHDDVMRQNRSLESMLNKLYSQGRSLDYIQQYPLTQHQLQSNTLSAPARSSYDLIGHLSKKIESSLRALSDEELITLATQLNQQPGNPQEKTYALGTYYHDKNSKSPGHNCQKQDIPDTKVSVARPFVDTSADPRQSIQSNVATTHSESKNIRELFQKEQLKNALRQIRNEELLGLTSKLQPDMEKQSKKVPPARLSSYDASDFRTPAHLADNTNNFASKAQKCIHSIDNTSMKRTFSSVGNGGHYAEESSGKNQHSQHQEKVTKERTILPSDDNTSSSGQNDSVDILRSLLKKRLKKLSDDDLFDLASNIISKSM